MYEPATWHEWEAASLLDLRANSLSEKSEGQHSPKMRTYVLIQDDGHG